MQVELSTVVQFASAVAVTIFGGYLTLLKHAYNQDKIESERRHLSHATAIDRVVEEFKKLVERVNAEEKATIRQDGLIQLVNQNHEGLAHDIDEIKQSMVTRAEWEPRMSGMEKTLTIILSELRGSRYTPTSSPPRRLPGGG